MKEIFQRDSLFFEIIQSQNIINGKGNSKRKVPPEQNLRQRWALAVRLFACHRGFATRPFPSRSAAVAMCAPLFFHSYMER